MRLTHRETHLIHGLNSPVIQITSEMQGFRGLMKKQLNKEAQKT